MSAGEVKVGEYRFVYRFGGILPLLFPVNDFDITLQRRVDVLRGLFQFWRGLYNMSGSTAPGWAPLETRDVEDIFSWLWDNASWLKEKEGLNMEHALELAIKFEERLAELDERLRSKGKVGIFVTVPLG